MVDIRLAVELIKRYLADTLIGQREVVHINDRVLVTVQIHERELRVRGEAAVPDLGDDEALCRWLGKGLPQVAKVSEVRNSQLERIREDG